MASTKFNEAIEGIDKTIDHLENVKKALTSADRNLRLAKDKAEDVSIKKLTRGNPTMTAKFKALPPIDPETLDQLEDSSEEEE